MKRTHLGHSVGKTIDVMQPNQCHEQSRSLSMKSDKNVNRYLIDK
jgi:hypothetical protein